MTQSIYPDHDKRALIVWGENKRRRALYKIISATGAKVSFAENPLLSGELDAAWSLVVVDYDSSKAAASALLAALAKLDRPPAVLVISSQATSQRLVGLLENEVLTNLFIKNVEVDSHELVVTVQKILRENIFGLEKYLSWGIKPIDYRIRSAAAKGPVIEDIARHLHEIGCNARLVVAAQTVADELIMNAVFNAPVDSNGRPKYAHLKRSAPLELEPSEEVLFRYACDGRDLALSVQDPFGRLSQDTVRNYLRKCFSGGEGQVDEKEGGAGLGLYHLFESVNHLVINVDINHRTELIGLMHISGTFRDFAERAKSIHLFYGNSSS